MTKRKSQQVKDQRKITLSASVEDDPAAQSPKYQSQENKGGRPSTLTQAKAELICDRIATHTCSPRELCEMYDDMPTYRQINSWRWKHQWFRALYAQAKVNQAELLAESLDELSKEREYIVDEKGSRKVDTGAIQSQRLQVDTRKWIACKLLPKVYGAQADFETTKLENDQLKEEIQELRSKLDAQNKSEY